MTLSALRDCQRLTQVVLFITSIPSVTGGLLVLLSFKVIPKIRNHSFFLLLGIVICDSLNSLSFLLPVQDDRTWECRLQGWWIHFFPLASAHLNLLTTVHIHLLITQSRARHFSKTSLLRISLLLLVLTLAISLMPFITDQYGKIGGVSYCWIALDEDGRNRRVGVAMRWGLQYAPVWTIFVVCFGLYYRIFQYTNKIFANSRQFSVASRAGRGVTRSDSGRPVESNGSGSSRESGDKVMQAVLLLRWYPVIMLLAWGGIILRQLYQFYSENFPCGVFAIFLAMLNLQGLMNTVVFMANSAVWQGWYRFLDWEVHDPSRGWLTQIKLSWLHRSHVPTPSPSLALMRPSDARSETPSAQ